MSHACTTLIVESHQARNTHHARLPTHTPSHPVRSPAHCPCPPPSRMHLTMRACARPYTIPPRTHSHHTHLSARAHTDSCMHARPPTSLHHPHPIARMINTQVLYNPSVPTPTRLASFYSFHSRILCRDGNDRPLPSVPTDRRQHT